MNDPLSRAIELAGGQSALAREVGVKQQNVWSWVNRTGKCPPEHVLAVEAATDGVVTRYQLRPDIYGPAPAETSAA